ncbi:MAG: hypothetical protein ABIH11_08225 [Candidatus Altiarchaeota archaeon]
MMYENIVEKSAIAVDVDGVLTDFRGCRRCRHEDLETRNYLLCPIRRDVAAALRKLKTKYRIILHTARGEDKRIVTQRWLEMHDIPYDELVLDKPYAMYYIDDRAIRFKDWGETLSLLGCD